MKKKTNKKPIKKNGKEGQRNNRNRRNRNDNRRRNNRDNRDNRDNRIVTTNAKQRKMKAKKKAKWPQAAKPQTKAGKRNKRDDAKANKVAEDGLKLAEEAQKADKGGRKDQVDEKAAKLKNVVSAVRCRNKCG